MFCKLESIFESLPHVLDKASQSSDGLKMVFSIKWTLCAHSGGGLVALLLCFLI